MANCNAAQEHGISKFKKCKICPNAVFNSEDEYFLHINDLHKGKAVDYYMCSDCGKQFKTRSELTHHINSKCGTVKRFKCKVCNQKLMTAGSLHNHMLRHTGVRSFMCRFCAKLFLTAGQLKVHERIHTHEKAFVCNVCGKGFCHRQSLITHSTLHTGIKPFQCENCGSSFSCVGNLIKHRRTHSDTCGLIPLTTHRVKNPTTKMKIKINTPANSRLKAIEKENKIKQKLATLDANKDEKPTINKVAIDGTHVKLDTSSEKYSDPNTVNLFCDIAIISCQENGTNHETATNHGPVNDNNFDPHQKNCDENETDTKENHFIGSMEYKLKENHLTDDYVYLNDNDDGDAYSEDSSDLVARISDEQSNDKISVSRTDNKIKCLNKNGKKKTNTIKKKCRRPSSQISKADIDEFIRKRGIKNKKEAMCSFCNKIYTNVKCLLKHEREHEKIEVLEHKAVDNSKYKCSCCKIGFENKDECIAHQHNVHADLLTCQECDKIFANQDSLRSHQNIFHKGVPRKMYLYVCEKCGKQFKQKALLKHHEENNCGTGPLFQCQICKKQFSSIHTRRSHMRIHDPEKKLLCKFCGKSFHWKGQLKIHERSHTGEKPFTCLYCPKAFSYRESLITHSSLHTGIKPYLCEACGSRFSCIGNLLKHRVTHANSCGAWYAKNRS